MSQKSTVKQIAAEIKTNLAEQVNKLKAQGIQPGLGRCWWAKDPRSMKYVAGKARRLPGSGHYLSQEGTAGGRQLRRHRRCRTRTQRRSGLHRVHRPAAVCLRASTRTRSSDMIDPAKDADGMHQYNL